jgi:hypothetical protein
MRQKDSGCQRAGEVMSEMRTNAVQRNPTILGGWSANRKCQEALQSTFSGRLDIFYPPNFGCLGRKASFSTATPVNVN